MMVQIKMTVCALALTLVSSEPPNSQYFNRGGRDEYNEPKAYEFGYQVKDDASGNDYNRQEASDGNQVRGEYRVALPDGRTQIVTYYADWDTGFHADVRYEGTAHYPEQYAAPPQNPANGGGFQAAPATSSVSIKDYSGGGSYSSSGGYSGYKGVGFSKQGPNPLYGAP